MAHQYEGKLKYHLEKANLYGILAKKYEYVNPERHIHFYKKYYHHVGKVEHYYLQMNQPQTPMLDFNPMQYYMY